MTNFSNSISIDRQQADTFKTRANIAVVKKLEATAKRKELETNAQNIKNIWDNEVGDLTKQKILHKNVYSVNNLNSLTY